MFIEPEEFVVPSVPRLHFEGLGNAQAKERVLNRLLARIAAVIKAREPEQAKEMVVGNDFPLPPPPHHDPKERQKRPRESYSTSSIESRHRAWPSAFGDN